MTKIDYAKFLAATKKAKTEEDVKNAYAKCFGIHYDTSDRHDLYTPQVLFEFKYDKNLDNVRTKASILAQILYYVRRLKFGGYTDKPISPILCLAAQEEVIFTETLLWKEFYVDEAGKYDWDLAPSNPDATLVKDLAETTLVKNLHTHKVQQEYDFQVFADLLVKYLDPQLALLPTDKKVINEGNFEDIFQYWNGIFGDAVRNGLKTSRYFVTDIQEGSTFFIKEESKVVFQFSGGEAKVKKILARDYEYFWSLYERVTNPDTIRGILAKIDRLSDDFMRRFHGEFFTPVPFAKKALDYLEKTLGKSWWQSGEYRLWDMAAGTGNLEYGLPSEALPYCYLSTLYVEDVEHLQKLFVGANIFQYDYLNDDVGNVFKNGEILFDITWKLPEKLRNDLRNPKLKWVILINPPFGTSSLAGTDETNKAGASDTRIRKVMHEAGLGETSRELFVQFLFRLRKEFDNKDALLTLFSTTKFLNSNNDQKFRDNIFQFRFEDGFVFSSANFSGTSKAMPFPVGVTIWELSKRQKLEEQNIILDVFNHHVEKIGTKQIKIAHRENFLNKWIKRPAGVKKFPPFSGGITVKGDTKDVRDRISENFIGCLMCVGSDFQHQNFTALLSGPYVSAGGHSITPENFEKAMVVHAVRRIPQANWLNNKDVFIKPKVELSSEFISDCTVWNLFSNSNQTVAMRDVVYQKTTYQVKNHFFPFAVAEVKKWKIADSDIAITLATAEDAFMCEWLEKQTFSTEAQAVLDKGKEIYQLYFASLGQMRSPKFKIQTYDAGWWQIRNAMADVYLGKEQFEELKNLHNALKNKLLPLINEYGFL